MDSSQKPGTAAPPPPYGNAAPDKLFPAWERVLKFLLIAGVIIIGFVGYRLLRPRTARPGDPGYFAPARRITSGSGLSLAPAISPDGSLIAFVSDRGKSGSFAIWTKPYDSGEPKQVTSGEFNEIDPDFSPDGRTLAYRSERDGGGIYTIAATGGSPPALIAKGGWRPRFSPDGRSIAFFTLTGSEDASATFGVGQIYIVAAGGGQPKRIQPDFPFARYPIWSPDGKSLLFSGISRDGVKDWWLAPVDGGAAVRIRAADALTGSIRMVGFPEQWRDGRIYFSGAAETAMHIWALPVAPGTSQPSGPPVRLTDGKDQEQQPAVGPGGTVLYSSLAFSTDVWSLPVDANRAQVTGKLRALTHDGQRAQLPGASANGARLVYLSNKSGVRDVWAGDTSGKNEQAVTSFRQIGYRPVLSPTGDRVIYPAMIGGKCSVLMQGLGLPETVKTLEGCFNVWDWSPDGASLLTFQNGHASTVELRRIATGERQVALSNPSQGIFGPRFSPDGRWIAFASGLTSPQARIFIAPLRAGGSPESEWIAVTPDPDAGDPAWSPDGSILYFHSKRDGYHCLWARKLGPGKKPEGEPIAVQHLHASGFGMYFLKSAEFGLAVTKDQLIFNLAKGAGGIWVTKPSWGR